MFRGSGVLYIPILSISLLGCLSAWSHLLNDGYSKPKCVCSKHDFERNRVLLKLPSQISLSNWELTKEGNLNISRQRTFCSEKIRSLPHYSPAFCLYRLRRDWLLFLGLDTTKDAWIESIEKRFLPNSSCLSHTTNCRFIKIPWNTYEKPMNLFSGPWILHFPFSWPHWNPLIFHENYFMAHENFFQGHEKLMMTQKWN